MSNIKKYYYCYFFDNLADHVEIKLKLRHGVVFKMFDCYIKYLNMSEPCIEIIYSSSEKEEARKHILFTLKTLGFIFGVPLHEKHLSVSETSTSFTPNNNLSKKNNTIITTIEKQVGLFKKEKDFFNECIHLLSIAQLHLFIDPHSEEDAFLYYFKIVEKISKRYYNHYTNLHRPKYKTKNAKHSLQSFLSTYCNEHLSISLTSNMLNTYSDNLYHYIEDELLGNIFGKISFFVTSYNLNFTSKEIHQCVKLRNKLAHGDEVSSKQLQELVYLVGSLALDMISFYFFKDSYSKFHILSKIMEDPDVWL